MSLRFSDNPQKTVLQGQEAVPATDQSTGSDIKILPPAFVHYTQDTMALASGSTRGLMSGEQAEKLNALRTNGQNDTLNAQLGQIQIPFFLPSVDDGTIEVFENALDNDIVFDRLAYGVSSGSSRITVLIDGASIVGFQSLAVGTSGGVAIAASAKTIVPGGKLSLQFVGSSTPNNMRLTFKGDMTLT